MAGHMISALTRVLSAGSRGLSTGQGCSFWGLAVLVLVTGLSVGHVVLVLVTWPQCWPHVSELANVALVMTT
jgi:hypothetical protein